MVTAELRVVMSFDVCNDNFPVCLNAPPHGRWSLRNGLSIARPFPPHPELPGPDLRVRSQIRRAFCRVGSGVHDYGARCRVPDGQRPHRDSVLGPALDIDPRLELRPGIDANAR